MKTALQAIAILFIVVIISGCSTQDSHNYRSLHAPTYLGETEGKQSTRANLQQEQQQSDDRVQERVVIYNATLWMTVKDPDSANARITEIAKAHDGYVQTLGNRRSVIRVKADKLHEAINGVSSIGKLKNKVISGDDVTDQYLDYQIRLDNAEKARARYLELLAKAENVEAALKVEKELERLNGEIDLLKGRLRQMGHLSEYSTITINLEEKVKPGIFGYVFIGLYEGIKWLFVRN